MQEISIAELRELLESLAKTESVVIK